MSEIFRIFAVYCNYCAVNTMICTANVFYFFIMKRKSLFIATVFGLASILSAQNLALQKNTPVSKQLPVRKEALVDAGKPMTKGELTEKIVTMPNGIRIKGVSGIPAVGNILNPEMKAAPQAASSREGFVLYEDFEAWSGQDAAWLPEGWTVDHKDSPASNRGWKMTQPLSAYDYISSKCLTYELFEEAVDEWVITPEVTVTPGMELCWSTMTSPYFYDWSYFNQTTFQLDEYVIVNDIKVNVSIDGGNTWIPVFSHAENLLNTAPDFFAMFDYTVRPFKLPLDAFVGATVKIGFQITGADGNTTFLDNVSIGLPPTNTAYVRPLSNLFFGLSETDENVPASIMVGPVFQPVKYSNYTKTKNAEFLWTYTDSSGEEKTSTEEDLTVTYQTDFTSEFSTRNNLYNFPVLRGESGVTSPDEFTFSGFYQAGGKGEYERYYTDTQDIEIIDLGLTIIDPVTEGSATYANIALPYFGYNNESDRYWSEYTFGGDWDEDNWHHLEKIADFFYSPETPMVIDGVRTIAFGKVNKNARFTAEIYLLDTSYRISNEPIATAICTGDDIKITNRDSANDLLALNFKFEEPIVISKAVAPQFIVAIGGFRDPVNVEYFSPEMSSISNPNKLGLGWLGSQLCWTGELMPFSWSSVANYTNDELVSFYIMLDATFPWLECENTEVTVIPGQDATVDFNSYYDGSQLTFEGLPEWLEATATGRYDKTVVKFTASGVADKSDAIVTVTAPGVGKNIKVLVDTSGIADIIRNPESGEVAIYSLDGKRVGVDNLAPGIYIRREGLKATKFIVPASR